MKNEMKNIIDHAATVFFLGAIVVGVAKGSVLSVLVDGIFLVMVHLVRIQDMCLGIKVSKTKHDDNDEIYATFTAQQLSQIFGAMSVAEHECQIEAEFCKEMDGLLDEILSIEDYDNNVVYKIVKV